LFDDKLVSEATGEVLSLTVSDPQRLNWNLTLRAAKSSETRRNAWSISVPSSKAG
jgi:hypothetical protein